MQYWSADFLFLGVCVCVCVCVKGRGKGEKEVISVRHACTDIYLQIHKFHCKPKHY